MARKTHTSGAALAAPLPRTEHLLGLWGLSAAALRELLCAARDLPASGAVVDAPLDGKTIANLFFEDSTRTRTSFSIAARRLGADVVDLASGGSSVSKGETLIDTALTVRAMGVAALVVRARQSGAAAMIARAVNVPVINAGDGRHEHPTQGLLDIYTLAQAHGRLDSFSLAGLCVAIVGDVSASRVARSAIFGMTTLGAKVVCVGPPPLVPGSIAGLASTGLCSVSRELDPVLARADAVMMLRIQAERYGSGSSAGDKAGEAKGPAPATEAVRAAPIASVREFREMYALTRERERAMKQGAIVMHPGPMNRGIEIDAEVADGPRSVITQQVTNGVRVRMAVLLRACAEVRGD